MQHLRELLLVGLAILATGCATTGAVPRPFPGAPPAPVEPASTAPRPVVQTEPDALLPTDTLAPGAVASSPAVTPGSMALASALGLKGVRYRSGGTDPSGFDCSGLVQYVFARQGIAMPRDVRRQFQVGYEIGTEEVRPGDLLFFRTGSEGASHVAIAIDGQS